MKKNVLLSLVLTFCAVTFAYGQDKMTVKEYIDKYKDLAIEQMRLYQIPASIKLAQGIVETSNGNSRLARLANNHFGIKCKTEWTGDKIYHDDDAQGECFRKYDSAAESYRDHSLFLRTRSRYACLFELKITDYKGWAYWLKASGYATNPKYPQMLIKTIEENELYKFDDPKYVEKIVEKSDPGINVVKGDYKTNNGVKYVIARSGDSMASIAQREGVPLEKILIYNDMTAPIRLKEGIAVYVQPKRTSSIKARGHVVEPGETTHSISQKYAITIYSLKEMNPKLKRKSPHVGQHLKLTK